MVSLSLGLSKAFSGPGISFNSYFISSFLEERATQTFNIFGPPKAYLWELSGLFSSYLEARTKTKGVTQPVLFLISL